MKDSSVGCQKEAEVHRRSMLVAALSQQDSDRGERTHRRFRLPFSSTNPESRRQAERAAHAEHFCLRSCRERRLGIGVFSGASEAAVSVFEPLKFSGCYGH